MTRDKIRPGPHRGTAQDDDQLRPPKLFAWLASLATVATILVPRFLARGADPTLRVAGLFLLALAAISIFTPFFLLGKHGRIKDGATYMQTRVVVDRGLYAVARHPQYLGYMLLAWGFAALSQHWLAALLAAAGSALFYLQAAAEERYCLARLGEPYARYLERIPRFNVVAGIVRRLRGGEQ
jgi:protein-S-isoprenylcysteine O-methyltransferase Ste14